MVIRVEARGITTLQLLISIPGYQGRAEEDR